MKTLLLSIALLFAVGCTKDVSFDVMTYESELKEVECKIYAYGELKEVGLLPINVTVEEDEVIQVRYTVKSSNWGIFHKEATCEYKGNKTYECIQEKIVDGNHFVVGRAN